MGFVMRKLSQREKQAGCAACWLALASVSWAEAVTAAPVAATVHVSAYQERLSSFMDGALLGNERAWVAHASAPPKAAARSGLNLLWQAEASSGWNLGGFVESASWIDGGAESVAALGFVNNQRTAQKNASYPFAVEAQSYRRWGVSIGAQRAQTLWGHASELWWRAKGFAVDDYRWSRADGTLTETLAGELGLQAQVEQLRLGGHSTFVNPQKTLGYGVGLDLGVQWHSAPTLHWQASLEDIGPRVRLAHVLSNSTQYNSNNVSHDAEGYIQYAPMTSGQYRDVSASLRIEPRLNLAGRWDARPGLTWFGGISAQKPFTQVHLGAQKTVSEGAQLAAAVYTGSGGLPPSAGLNWRYRTLTLNWRGDALSPEKARIWSLSAALDF